MSDDTDAQEAQETKWLREAREGGPGSHDAFAHLVRLHQGAVRAYMCQFTTQGEDIDDLAQESFLAAYRSLANFDGKSSLRTWLIGIARHRALTWLRDKKRRHDKHQHLVEAALLEEQTRIAEVENHTQEDTQDYLDRLSRCMAKLSDAQRTLIQQRYIDGESLTVMAEALKRKAGALRVTLHRIRGVLRQCMEGLHTKEAP